MFGSPLTAIVWLLICVMEINGQGSGSALNLAQLNANLMNTKCALTPCQSACLVRQPETGCYICSPSCGAGNVGALAEGGMPGGQGFYGCTSETSWVQCPVTCEHKYDNFGCFQCICNPQNSPDTADVSHVPEVLTTRTSSLSTNRPTQPEKIPTAQSPNLKLNKTSVTEKTTTSTTKTTTRHTTPSPSPKADDIYIPTTRTEAMLSRSKQTTSQATSFTSTKATINSGTELYQQVENKLSKFKVNNLTFVLFGIIGALLICLVYFVYAWRKTVYQLQHNVNELYFVEKAYRQDSNARLRSNEMMDPVYAEMTPQPPPRPDWPPGTRTDTQSPQRTLSVSSETPIKEGYEDTRHDYLELI